MKLSTLWKLPTPTALLGFVVALCAPCTGFAQQASVAPACVVVLEFPSLEQARKWYHSPEYAPALAIRTRAGNSKVIMVEGV